MISILSDNFLLVINSNLGRIFYRFWNVASFKLNFLPPPFIQPSIW